MSETQDAATGLYEKARGLLEAGDRIGAQPIAEKALAEAVRAAGVTEEVNAIIQDCSILAQRCGIWPDHVQGVIQTTRKTLA